MQKLFSSKSKRSQPLPPADADPSAPAAIEDSLQESPNHLKKFFAWKTAAPWLFFGLGVSGVAIVSIIGLQYLTAPDATPDSELACKSQISGDWQTPFGKVKLQEESNNLVSGKYEYVNFERGKIVGEMTGKLSNNVITFDWKETPKQQPKQQGKGIIVFAEGCKEFYGSYGVGENTNNFGNWQGSRIPK
jgi:hypothetical protein